MLEIAEITEVRRTSDENEANRLLKAGWKMIRILDGGYKLTYVLAKGV